MKTFFLNHPANRKRAIALYAHETILNQKSKWHLITIGHRSNFDNE